MRNVSRRVYRVQAERILQRRKMPRANGTKQLKEKSPKNTRELGKHAAPACRYTTWQFHHWLIEKGYLILKPKVPRRNENGVGNEKQVISINPSRRQSTLPADRPRILPRTNSQTGKTRRNHQATAVIRRRDNADPRCAEKLRRPSQQKPVILRVSGGASVVGEDLANEGINNINQRNC